MKPQGYSIEKLHDGGFIVYVRGGFESGMASIPIFAATEIVLALEYIRKKLMDES